MSAQRYRGSVERERMAHNLCPECGEHVEAHLNDGRFWVPRVCDLLPRGVVDRIEQFRAEPTQVPQ